MTKVWSREEMEAATKALVDFGIYNLDMCSHEEILDRPEESYLWVKADRLLELQCSLTASEKDLAESKKLLTLAEPGESLSADNMRAWYLERYEFLKRQEGR